jgi:hypothetical protein
MGERDHAALIGPQMAKISPERKPPSGYLEALKAEHAALGARIAELEGKASPKRTDGRPVERRDVEVIQLNDERVDDMPDLAEAKKLLAIVRPHVPGAERHAADPDRLLRNFCAALRYVANCGRRETPNQRISIEGWIRHLQDWLRSRDCVAHDVGGSAFTAACLASDVVYVRADPSRGFLWEFGLEPHSRASANPSAWRAVLERGSVRAPTMPARPVAQAPRFEVRGF